MTLEYILDGNNSEVLLLKNVNVDSELKMKSEPPQAAYPNTFVPMAPYWCAPWLTVPEKQHAMLPCSLSSVIAKQSFNYENTPHYCAKWHLLTFSGNTALHWCLDSRKRNFFDWNINHTLGFTGVHFILWAEFAMHFQKSTWLI